MASHSHALKPERTVPLEVEVLRSERISPSFVRVTVGAGEIDRFAPRGFDQWFRLFLPPTDAPGLRLPDRDGWGGYARLLATPKQVRPTMRNYTVRAFRPACVEPGAERGAELDIDFVLHVGHESGELEGVAARWASECRAGDPVGILDEGIGADIAPETTTFLLVGDETALPAIAGVVESLPADARGVAIIEVPHTDDAQPIAAPAGVEVRWIVRPRDVRHGALAYRAAREVAIDEAARTHAYVSGESALATGLRRYLVTDRGLAKTAVSFCGYWRLPKGAPAIDSAEAVATAGTSGPAEASASPEGSASVAHRSEAAA